MWSSPILINFKGRSKNRKLPLLIFDFKNQISWFAFWKNNLLFIDCIENWNYGKWGASALAAEQTDPHLTINWESHELCRSLVVGHQSSHSGPQSRQWLGTVLRVHHRQDCVKALQHPSRSMWPCFSAVLIQVRLTLGSSSSCSCPGTWTRHITVHLLPPHLSSVTLCYTLRLSLRRSNDFSPFSNILTRSPQSHEVDVQTNSKQACHT